MATEQALGEIRYASSGGVKIAYRLSGVGPADLVYVGGWITHLEVASEDPGMAGFGESLGGFARVVNFDKRGTGLSDRVPEVELPTLEQRMDDIRAVMDAVGLERASLLGFSEGGPLAMLFAATYPHRTANLVVWGSYASMVRRPGYPWDARRSRSSGQCATTASIGAPERISMCSSRAGAATSRPSAGGGAINAWPRVPGLPWRSCE